MKYNSGDDDEYEAGLARARRISEDFAAPLRASPPSPATAPAPTPRVGEEPPEKKLRHEAPAATPAPSASSAEASVSPS